MSEFKQNYLNPDIYIEYQASIGADTSISGKIFTNNFAIFNIIMPSEWTPADITLEVSNDGTSFQHLYADDGTELKVEVSAGNSFTLEHVKAIMLGHWKYLKIRSGVAGAFVNQTGARQLKLIGRKI